VTITSEDWQKYTNEHLRGPRPVVTNEQKAAATRAEQALNHPGFAILQDVLSKHRTRVEQESKSAEYRLAHGRGVTAEEVHRLREDIACCSGWLKALEIALDVLPEVVKAGREPT
jgi:CHAD domain-containing protein